MEKYFPQMGLTMIHGGYGDVFAKLKDEVKKRSTWTSGDSLGQADTPESIHTFFLKTSNVISVPDHSYFEAQIWGELCLEDVDYMLVGCHDPIDPERLEALRKTKIPIYSCRPSFKNDRPLPHNLQRGDQI